MLTYVHASMKKYLKNTSLYQFVLHLTKSFAAVQGELSVPRHQHYVPVPCQAHPGPVANASTKTAQLTVIGMEE